MDKIPENALVVVADGGKAILFRNSGVGGAVKLKEERRVTPDSAVEQGPSGSRPADQSVKQTAEASFVNTLAHLLHRMHDHKEFSAVVLIAAPTALGELRSALHGSVTSAVVGSLAKDYTNHTTHDIEKALSS